MTRPTRLIVTPAARAALAQADPHPRASWDDRVRALLDAWDVADDHPEPPNGIMAAGAGESVCVRLADDTRDRLDRVGPAGLSMSVRLDWLARANQRNR